MKKIDKSAILSRDYKNWLNGLEDIDHPKYNSSNGEYYNDIKMSLLYCQNGLCAYTERELCDPKFFTSDNWNENKYIRNLTDNDKKTIKGDLEHFDESLKEKKAWEWNNLFIVDTHINCRVKGRKFVKNILKPDTEDYDPNKYLKFDFEAGIFSSNTNLTDKEKQDVEEMISTLGINCYNFERKKKLKNYLLLKELGENPKIDEYFTAWEMTLESLDNN